MPKGAEPAGSAVGEEGSSVRLPPSTENALIESAPVSTTQSVFPPGPRRASSAPACAVPIGVLPSRASDPSAPIAYLETLLLAVLTVKRNSPSFVIST